MNSSRKNLSKERGRTISGTFAKGCTTAKVIRDAKILKDKALYIIEIDKDGNVIKAYDNPPFENLLDCIVIIAPVRFNETYIEEAVVLEIGLSRFVPYGNTELKAVKPGKTKQRQVIRGRTQLEAIPWEVMQKVLPTLWKAIQFCVDLKMEKWTKGKLVQGPVDGGVELGKRPLSVYESWITIRIPKEYALIYTILRLKDELDKHKPGKNYAHVVELLIREFDFFKSLNQCYSENFPEEIIKKSNVLRIVAERFKKKINTGGYTIRSITAIRYLLKEKDIKYLLLFDNLSKVFKIPKAPTDDFLDAHERVLGVDKNNFLTGCILRPCRIYKREKRRVLHAQDCLSIGILGGREHMIELDIRNIRNRLTNKGGLANEILKGQDSDIPL